MYQSALYCRSIVPVRGEIDNPHPEEDQHRRDTLGPRHRVHAGGKADAHGHHRLHVGVHAHQHGLQALLPYGYEEIGDEGRAHHDEEHLQYNGRRQCLKIRPQQAGCERQGIHGGKDEHPLHEGNNAVFPDKRLKNAHVAGKAKGIDEHQQHPAEGGPVRPSRRTDRVQHDEQYPGETDSQSDNPVRRNPVPERDGRHNHRHHRGHQAQHRGIHGGSHGYRLQKRELRQEQPQHRRQRNLPQVPHLHPLLGAGHRRGYAEKQQSPGRAQQEQRHRRQIAVIGNVLAENYIEPEYQVGRKAGQIPGQCLFGCSSHLSLLLKTAAKIHILAQM